MPFDDWKSCRRDKRLVGSNPTLSVIYFSNNKGFRHLQRSPLHFCWVVALVYCQPQRIKKGFPNFIQNLHHIMYIA